MRRLTFQEVVQQDPFDLTLASLYFAKEMAYPDLNIDAYMEKFARLAEQALPFINPKRSFPFQANQLRDFLFDQEGYKVEHMGFKNPENYYLNALLDRKKGLDICTGIFFYEIARHLEIPVNWADVPGYLLIRVESPKQVAYLAPVFHCYRTTIQECKERMKLYGEHDGPFEKSMLEPVHPKRILILLLEDLLHALFLTQNHAAEVDVVKFLLKIEPDNPYYWRRYAVLLDLSGAKRKALEIYEEYFTRFPDEEENDDFRVNFWLAARVVARRN